jgi:glycosyltransferase involved in cell wall biosynthesis
MRLAPEASMRVAVSWNSETMRRMAKPPSFVQLPFERVTHSVPRYGELYARVVRRPASTPEILFVGRVTPFKGLRVAIEALARLRSEHDIQAQLVVVGPEDSGHGAELRALAQRLGVGDLVRWRGQRTPEEVAQALATAHVLIVPSDWEEPFPLVTIEGAFAGVPLVAADVGGISEGMYDEEHALLFPRGDSGAAAAAIARTLREPASTRARVERAGERAESFRIEPYLAEQARFVEEAREALDPDGAL